MNPYNRFFEIKTLKRPNSWSSYSLEALPIYRREPEHKYVWEPTNQPLLYSTTQVINDKPIEALRNIERYRHGPEGWEIRGKTIHHCLQENKLGNPPADPGIFNEWVEPLLNHEFWKLFETFAVEYMLCDLEKSVGGQLDLLGYDHESNRLMLIDLKTQSRKSRRTYKTDAQLGSYVEALKTHHGLEVDVCKTIWSRPGEVKIGDDQSVDKCVEEWNKAWIKFEQKEEIPF